MTKPVKLYNTTTRDYEEVTTQPNGKAIGIYSCGPTVYHDAHIGNMRSFVFADVLRRTLEAAGYDVAHVMNITDVGHLTDDGNDGEDKMLVAMRREGKTAKQIAEIYEDRFHDDSRKLNLKTHAANPRATDFIPQQIDIVERLEAKGYTYKTADGIYFDTAKFPDYAKFAKLDVENLRGGDRVELGDKRNKTDFALWKFSPEDAQRDMEWDSPWGKGFPGWHLECSAMSETELARLGADMTIHTGGIDHIPVHHTNEIAQSCCAHDKEYFKLWMHGEFLVLGEDAKMSKSSGNFLTVSRLEEQGFHPLALRYLFLQTHYRQQLQFSFKALQAAQNGLFNLWGLIARLETADSEVEVPMSEAIFNDLDTCGQLSALWKALGDKNLSAAEKRAHVKQAEPILGLDLLEDHSDLIRPLRDDELSEEIVAKRNARNDARTQKDWATSDQLRDELIEAGYRVQDTKDGTQLSKA